MCVWKNASEITVYSAEYNFQSCMYHVTMYDKNCYLVSESTLRYHRHNLTLPTAVNDSSA